MRHRLGLAAALFLLGGGAAAAQGLPPGGGIAIPSSRPAAPQGSFLGSVPPQPATADTVPLTLSDAITRALKYNLGVMTLEQQVESARGARWRALAGLLPTVDARAGEAREKINLAAFGFTGASFPGISTVVGPFTVFDARVFVSQPVVDVSALYNVRREGRNVDAATFEARNAREVVVLVAASLYLQTVAAASRIEAVRAQTDTADALFTLATDLQRAGIVPQIDVLRAQVEVETRRQRLIMAETDFQKQKFQLARAIGLPASQAFDLIEKIPYSTMPSMTVDEALKRAYDARADYRAALARVQAADADHRAAAAEALPSVVVNADYGAIGPSAGDAQATFTVLGAVRVPIFNGGHRRGRRIETEATLRERQAEADDFRQRIESEVRTAFLDLQATEAQLRVAQGIVDLAAAQLTQAQDRFRAGVTSNLEVIQAQEAVATAAENQIDGLYANNVAKASLARVLGVAEEMAKTVLGGSH